MGWRRTARSFGIPTTARGIIRKSLSTSSSSWEREARRRQRELEQQRRELAKMQELERARFEVNEYENYIEVIKSIHKECGDPWNWHEIKSSPPPEEPQFQHKNEMAAQGAFDNYVPSFFDKIFRRIEKKKSVLLKEIEKAREEDKTEYKKTHDEYVKNYQEWINLIEIAKKICAGSIEAYIEAIKEANPFKEIEQIGSSIKFSVNNKDLIECNLNVRDEKVIPKEEKFLLKSGKLSVKQMPISRFYDLYQDYICACVLRIARELFALLPVEMALINAYSKLLNTKTGHLEDMPILSVLIPRKTMEDLNFETIDPSDSIKNFVYKMHFKKDQGFNSVEVLNPSDYQK
jgi:hypothetical protein